MSQAEKPIAVNRVFGNSWRSFLAFATFFLSYMVNGSILWGLLHMFLGQWYVLYWIFGKTNAGAAIFAWMQSAGWLC